MPGSELRPQHRHRGRRVAASSCSSTTTSRRRRAGFASCSTGALRHPDHLVFGGPIRVRLEGSRLRMCGREAPPITTLDDGLRDREIELVWGANMAIDRRAFELAGLFDPGVPYGFDEDMWERRLRDAGGRIMYVARAGLVHRRDRQRRAARAARPRGLPARAQPARLQRVRRPRAGPRRGAARAGRLRLPHLPLPLRERHPADGALRRPRARVPRRACMSASPESEPPPADARSGPPGLGRERHRRRPARARAGARSRTCSTTPRSGAGSCRRDSSARRSGARTARSTCSASTRPTSARSMARAVDGARAQPPRTSSSRSARSTSRRRRSLESHTVGDRAAAAASSRTSTRCSRRAPPGDADWIVVVDDDVELPRGFLDRLLFVRGAVRLPARPARAAPDEPRRLDGLPA